jgi:Arc/MetJ-type ribon-helix-helix transcriptional regulator
MAYAFPQDIQRQLDQLMATGAFRSEDELLRQAVTTLAAQKDDLTAIAASLKDFDNGERGISAAESLGRVRTAIGLES